MNADLDFLMQRHLKELTQASIASSHKARKIHRELAARYAERINARFFFYPSATERLMRSARARLRKLARRAG